MKCYYLQISTNLAFLFLNLKLEEMAILLLESKRSQQSKAAKPTEYTTGSVCKASCCKPKTVTKKLHKQRRPLLHSFK